jgi:tetratricopeptide (TPR) repeat protein/predicted Ser/Thr protein kinase
MEEPEELARFARAKALFAVALALPAAEREELLAQECVDDAALRRVVVGLRRHAVAAASADFLGGTAAAPLQAAPPAWLAIPGFQILAVIDAGSSGYVFRAEQERPRREVAIKVLRLDHQLAPGMVARFQREAEILARLAHPGIAQVLEAGVAESAAGPLPWIAMELVRGRDLSTWVAEERPSARATVALFHALCQAVGHAHERGVVHRDLKPSNVLVDSDGRLRVIDFGIARTLEDSRASAERTRTGLVMGTLAYMAPEQARGDGADVGGQADVYALGVMLFEALSGRLPLEVDAVDVLEGVRIVREVEPVRLRALQPDLAEDLETILIAALEKDPARRYAGAAALGNDLANWLENRPVYARRPTLAYQARKFVRRNRALTVSAGVVMLSLAGGLVFALRGLATTRAQRNARSELVDVFSGKFFDFAPRLGFSDELRPDLEEVLAILERQLEDDPTNRSLRLELARALQELGNLDQARRDHAAADVRYARAFAVCESVVAEDPADLVAQTRLAQLLAKRGETARDLGDHAGRDRWFARALELDERLVRAHPHDRELREDLGWSLARVAQVAAERDDHAESLRLQLRRLADAEELVREEPTSWKYVYNLSHAHYFLAGLRLRTGRTGEEELAREHLHEGLRLARTLVELRESKRDAVVWLVHALKASSNHALDEGRGAEAQALAEEALTHVLEIASRDPYREEHLEMLLSTAADASDVYHANGRAAEILRTTERMRRISAARRASGEHVPLLERFDAVVDELETRALSSTPPPRLAHEPEEPEEP